MVGTIVAMVWFIMVAIPVFEAIDLGNKELVQRINWWGTQQIHHKLMVLHIGQVSIVGNDY